MASTMHHCGRTHPLLYLIWLSVLQELKPRSAFDQHMGLLGESGCLGSSNNSSETAQSNIAVTSQWC